MVSWRWLKLGLHLKRWVLAICAGTILLIFGAISLAVGLFDLGPDNVRYNPYELGFTLIACGVALVFTGVYRLVRRVEKLFKRRDERRGIAEIAYQDSQLERGPRLVCLGGGHGLSNLLSGLRQYAGEITAVVSVADDGGSSGRLRHDFDMLPPGDIRNCLIALADSGPVMAQLLQYRFDDGEFSGHSFGNLFITVLARIREDFGLGVREANRILNVRGRVLPATLDKVSLVATHADGSKTTGQRHIAATSKPITELQLKPEPGEPPRDVLQTLAAADAVILGPGSLYTSVLPNLLEKPVVEAIAKAEGKVFFVINTMGQPGETENFAASDHYNALLRHAPGLRVDYLVINSYKPSPAKLAALEEKSVRLTEYDRKNFAGAEVKVIFRDVIDSENPQLHDPKKLSAVIMEVLEENRR